MAICIDGNFVCLGGGCFCQTPTGVEFSGEAVANQFCDERKFQGQVSGYMAGGYISPVAPVSPPAITGDNDRIDKFSFSSDTPSTDIAEITQARRWVSGQSSDVSGYVSGGSSPDKDTIDKFPFSSDSPATDVGEILCFNRFSTGQSAIIPGFGYVSGGQQTPSFVNTIQKFPFAADAPTTDVAETTQSRYGAAGASSNENGYNSGGFSPPTSDRIDKFPFSSDSPATDVGETLGTGAYRVSGQSSSTHGYMLGSANLGLDTMQKFSFSSDSPATDVGELICSARDGAGQSSVASGYVSGGTCGIPGTTTTDVIQKFPFTSDTNSSDIAELSVNRSAAAGHQV